MRKFISAVLVITFISLVPMQSAKAEIPARAKAAMTIIGYGTAGGALVGAATMAFGTSTRAVAQGASLGLYAGIIFSAYVLFSHGNRGRGSYDRDNTIYRESNDIYGDEYNSEEGGGGDSGQSGFFNRFESMHSKFQTKKKGAQLPPIHVNIFQMSF